jgi:hypothetical protein
MLSSRLMTYPRALLAALALACAGDTCAQTELERLGGGPGGVPQWPGSARTFFNERSGERPKPRQPRPAAPVEDEDDDTEIAWRAGLIAVQAHHVPASQFFLEFHRATGIPVRLDPGAPSHVSANIPVMRLATALSLILPKNSYRLVRRDNVPLNAPDEFVGLVVGPVQTSPADAAPGGKPVIGATVIGTPFAVPGETPHVDAPALPIEPSPEPGDRSPESGDRSPELAPSNIAAEGRTSKTPDSRLQTPDSNSRRIAELLEARHNRRK